MPQDELRPMGFRGHPMPVALKITMALNIYASGSFQGSTGDMSGVSQTAAQHYIKEVTNALFKRAIDYVCDQTNPDSQAEKAIGFGAIAGFPQVQSVMDCTHVAIKAQNDQPATFINRKGFHSINAQLVCDHQKCFLQVWARFLGSSHDAHILRQSQVPQLFRPPINLQGWNLWDKGYPIEDLTAHACEEPLQCSGGEVQQLPGSTQLTVEKAIGLLKMRFHCFD
ncbi:putative nuclease HARBI1 [Heterodontus francisci]|uniref:putative nuclease HARBI1 n=1 Tax=Heterodontus francisci TaxID=7792 RepID=UPI00355B1340